MGKDAAGMNTVAIDEPVLRSLALTELPEPDYADVTMVTVPQRARSHLPTDPAALAGRIFSARSAPPAVMLLIGLRQALVPLLGVRPSPPGTMSVSQVAGPEALIAADERHLEFRAAVAHENDMVRVTTAVRFHGWRGRLYFVPVRVLHPIITRAMIRGAIRSYSREAQRP